MPDFERMVGSRAQVWHGTAHHTSGGLTKSDLVYDEETQRIKSKKKVALAKKHHFLEDWLKENGHTMKKGEFALIPKNPKNSAERRARKARKTARASRKSARASRKSRASRK